MLKTACHFFTPQLIALKQMEQHKLLTHSAVARIAVNMFFYIRIIEGLVLHNTVTKIGRVRKKYFTFNFALETNSIM